MSYSNTSPWNAGSDLGTTFANLMLNMAQLKRAQRADAENTAYRLGQLEREDARIEMQRSLIKAQTENQKANAGYDLARTDSEKLQQTTAKDAGLAALFQSLNQQGLPVNPLTGGKFPATPENIKLLTNALLQQQLMTSAASSPQAAASTMRPIEANKDTNVIDPVTRAIIESGPVSPTPGFTLGPGQRRYDAEGNMIEENPKVSGNDLNGLSAILRSALQNVNTLGVDTSGIGRPPYMQNPAMGQTFTNSMNIANLLQGKIQEQLGGKVTAPQAAGAQKSLNDLQPGEVYNGYRWKGGDKKDKNNWEKVK